MGNIAVNTSFHGMLLKKFCKRLGKKMDIEFILDVKYYILILLQLCKVYFHFRIENIGAQSGKFPIGSVLDIRSQPSFRVYLLSCLANTERFYLEPLHAGTKKYLSFFVFSMLEFIICIA